MTGSAALSDEAKNYITNMERENNQLKNLQSHIIQFEKKVAELENKNRQLEDKNRQLEEKLKLALYRQFGRHVERFTGEGQPLLFESEEKAAPLLAAGTPETTTVKEHTRLKRGRKPLDENLPREHTYLDIDEADKHCACGDNLVCIGEEVSERLHIEPQKIWVEVIHKKKYACKTCEGSGDEDKKAVRMARTPGNIMPGSIATPGLLSFIFTQKYCDYMPFYRQQAAFERIGVNISRQNMDNWQKGVCEKLEPLLTLMKKHLKTGEVINMDETTMKVMDEPGKENKQVSYMWLARGGPPGKKVIWYEYHDSRAAKHIVEILSGYSGYLQTDGYDAYEKALKELTGKIIHAGCFAHVRRYFFEAMKISRTPGGADDALAQIKGLYTVEEKLREKLSQKTISAEEFLKERKEKCKPLLTAFHGWLEDREGKVLDSSKLGEAIKYTLGQWPLLVHYLDHIELTPDNNAAERAIRPFVMGRKNWNISGSPAGAKSSCQLYTLIETAKANKLNPYQYLKTIFEQAAEMNPSGDWSKLLPWNLNQG
ncbi:IS66 family transposase [Spirochaetia bacterium]|nr:IS66 family transposase [Spirochaetia bacterium]